LHTIAGTVPELIDLPSGCAFADRCSHAIEACKEARPALASVSTDHAARCIRLDAVARATPGVSA
jgi:peptide/nickel transport system ATP-binding protein